MPLLFFRGDFMVDMGRWMGYVEDPDGTLGLSGKLKELAHE